MQDRAPTTRLLPLLGLVAFAAPLAAHDMFRTMDANHDGKISAEEHAAGAKAMFDRMDADHDGKITAAECDAGHAKMQAEEKGEKDEHHMGGHHMGMHRMSGADMVKQMDTDGDGTVSANEHADWAAKMFAKADANHDGSVSEAEMKSAHAGMDMDHDMDDMHHGHHTETPQSKDKGTTP